MVCKEDVVSWFKELESYKRIDAMCSLLNMCLPFELRFIGTYLEELGKRDFQELRGAEIRANNPTDLAADIGGANTDHRTRRKMALYVSLLRSCNYACASTLYNVMVGLEQTGLLGGIYGDPLEELLLLYTMALHHPAFTFDQHSHFGEILEKLKIEDQRNRYVPPPVSVNAMPSGSSCLLHTNVTPNLSVPPPSVSGLTPMNTVLYVKTPPLQGSMVGSEQINEIVNPSVGLSNPPMQPSEPHFPMMPEPVPPPPPGMSVPQYNMAEYVMGAAHWPGGLIMTAMNQPLEVMNYPPPPSPMISGPSSPCDSRAGSPHLRALLPPMQPPLRPTRRPSQDSTPPPQHDHHLHLMPTFNHLSINERNIEEEKFRDPDSQMKAMARLQSIEKPNGIRRPSRSNKATNTYSSTHLRLQHSSGSESGSSTGSHSPPDTPVLAAPAPPGPGRPRQPPSPQYFTPHFQRSTYPAAFSSYRPGYSPFLANGEAPLYGPQYAGYVQVPLYAPPKLSCWNCGAPGHSGTDCKEPSIEDMTRTGVYQLDYSSAPPDINDK